MVFICHQHGKLSRQRQHRRMIGKEYGTSLSSEQNDFVFGTLKVPFASYGRRGPAARAGERTVTDTDLLHSRHAAFAQMFFQIG